MKRLNLRHPYLVIWGVVAVFLLCLAAATAGVLYKTRSMALAEGRSLATQFATGAEANVNRALLAIDTLLASTGELLAADMRRHGGSDAQTVAEHLAQAGRPNLMLRYVAMLDHAGRPLASSLGGAHPDAVDLPSGFLAAVTAPGVASLSVSAAIVSPSNSERVLYLARPLRAGDDALFVMVAQVSELAFVDLLMQGLGRSEIEVTLERAGGDLLVGVAPQADVTQQRSTLVLPLDRLGVRDLFLSSWQASTRLSGAVGLVTARPLLYDNLWVTASLPQASALESWNNEARTLVGGALAMGAMVLAIGLLIVTYLQRMRRSRQIVERSRVLLEQALEAMVNGFMLLDVERNVVQWNRRFEETFPWLIGSVRAGMPFRLLLETTVHYHLPGASSQDKQDWVERRLHQQQTPQGTVEQRLPTGRFIQITERITDDGGVVIVYHDVTDLRQATAEAEHLAFYDTLTGLPNRRLLLDRIDQAGTAAQRRVSHCAVLFIDLDNFKTLNDTMGHETGDQLLQQVARRLEAAVRASDSVARLGGDEFVVMLTDLAAEVPQATAQARRVADKVVQALARPFQIADQTHHSSCSIGITLFGDAPQTPGEVLKQADIAMYQAKAQHGNGHCLFDPGMQATLSERARLVADLQQALPLGQFRLHLQPQFDRDARLMGAEGLLRWQHPARGMVGPGRFISVAETSELIVPIGQWVLRQACEMLARWRGDDALKRLSLSVNVSARQFRQGDFVGMVARLLEQTGAPAHLLELELTESLVLDDVDDTIGKMHQLRVKGVRFAIDDFGTGYSSLAYLTQLPLNRLKIDRSFVMHLGQRHSDGVVVQTILGMARNLDLEVVAEGVETNAQRDFLALHGCDLYQGYLLGKPMPDEELEALARAAAASVG